MQGTGLTSNSKVSQPRQTETDFKRVTGKVTPTYSPSKLHVPAYLIVSKGTL